MLAVCAVLSVLTALVLGNVSVMHRFSPLDTCAYPCSLAHGCVCDSTKAWIAKDGQFYGACTSCDKGWGGMDCLSLVTNCVNNGIYANSSCTCENNWQGSSCDQLRCINSISGAGPDSVKPVNVSTNFCDQCLPGYEGLACDRCTASSQCPSGSVCYTDLKYYGGVKKIIDCDLVDELWLQVLTGLRPNVKARGRLECTDSMSRCSLGVWRVEPNDEYLDAVFFCSMADCSSDSAIGLYNTSIEPVPNGGPAARHLMEAVIGCCLFALLALGALPIAKQSRMTYFAVTGVLLTAAVVVHIVVCTTSNTLTITSLPANITTTRYVCKSTKCTCAADPPNASYSPFCSSSVFGTAFVPLVSGETAMTCDVGTGNCVVSQSSVGSLTLKFRCNASECSPNRNDPPSFSEVKVNKSVMAPVVSVIVIMFSLIAISYVIAQVRTHRLIHEFLESFSAVELLSPSSEAPSPSFSSSSPLQLTHQRPAGNASDDNPLDGDKRYSDSQPLAADVEMRGAGEAPSVLRTSPQATLNVLVDSVGYSIEGIQLIEQASFDFRSGETVAIIGGSGAGKTTLIDVITAREKHGDFSGKIVVNGTDINSSNRETYKRMIGYVGQEDVLSPALTVRETIFYSAKLKLPIGFDDELVARIVQDTITLLGLERCADTIVGSQTRRGISGGEKRRVSIATELVANPRILFLDEPTSGLDSVSALEVMRAIVNLAKRPSHPTYAAFFDFQPAVVFSIHQPSVEICDMFDRLVVVSRGRILYAGPAESALSHASTFVDFSRRPTRNSAHRRTENIADELLKIEHFASESEVAALMTTPSPPDDVAARRVGPHPGPCVFAMTDRTRRYFPDTWGQIQILTKRTIASFMGSYYLVVAHVCTTLFLTIVLSILYSDFGLSLSGVLNKAGLLTFLLLISGFSSLTSLDLFTSEWHQFRMERENGCYSTAAYYVVKVVFDYFPFRIIPSLILSGVIYFTLHFRIDGNQHFLWFAGIICLFSMFVTGICYCVAIVTPSFGTSALVSAFLILWHTIFGGLMVQLDSVPFGLSKLKYLSPVYYAYEALMVNELDGQMCFFNPTTSSGSNSEFIINIGCNQFLANLGLSEQNFTTDVVALAAWSVALLFVNFGLLSILRR